MPRTTDPKRIGKPMPKGTGAQVTIEANEDDPWVFDAIWRGLRVGYARCSLGNDRLLIGDFLVEDSRYVPWRAFNNLRCWLKIPCSRRNFRSHGIGSKLIDAVLAKARGSSIDEVWGSVTMDDIESTDYLLSLYESRGFTIFDRDAECLENATKKIVLTLAPEG